MDYNKLYILTFQLTTSQGGRQEHTIFHHGPEVFQLTTSQGGRPDIPEIRTVITNFNSRPRKEVDAFLSWLAELLANHFNSRPRKEVDIHRPCTDNAVWTISTHDLARRSTKLRIQSRTQNAFQLTTSQGGRRCGKLYLLTTGPFQLTTSQGGRHGSAATTTKPQPFQLTTSQGDRHHFAPLLIFLEIFQLTTSQGGRPIAVIAYKPDICISTHDLARRSTWESEALGSWFCISTHDLTRRSTTFLSKQRIPLHISTHDLTRRSTSNKLWSGFSCNISTHDLTRRSTAIFTQKVFLSKSLFVLIAYNTFILY